MTFFFKVRFLRQIKYKSINWTLTGYASHLPSGDKTKAKTIGPPSVLFSQLPSEDKTQVKTIGPPSVLLSQLPSMDKTIKNIDNCQSPFIECNSLSLFVYGKLGGNSSMFSNDYEFAQISQHVKES